MVKFLELISNMTHNLFFFFLASEIVAFNQNKILCEVDKGIFWKKYKEVPTF
jgi:hypothetical protein